MICETVRPLLSDHFDGRFLPGDSRRLEIEAHLACCPPCAQVLADYDRIRQAVRPEAVPLPDPAAFESRLRERILEKPVVRTDAFRRLPAVAAAALLLALGVAWTFRPAPQRDGPALAAAPIPTAPKAAPSQPPASWRLLGDLRIPNPTLQAPGLGLGFRHVSTDLASVTQAALVETVAQGSPAESAGILPGDLILSVNGRPAARLDPAAWTAATGPGRNVRLEILGAKGRCRPLELVATPCR